MYSDSLVVLSLVFLYLSLKVNEASHFSILECVQQRKTISDEKNNHPERGVRR